LGRRKYNAGTFVRLVLADGSFGYGRMLEPPYIAFYNYRTLEPDSDLDEITSSPILFKVAVNLLAPEAWSLIGWRDLEDHLIQPLIQFTSRCRRPRKQRWSGC
jgi:hypothetical protein